MEVGLSEADELLPISALQHLVYCERQCALIHIERIWTENELTAEGRVIHERVDLPGLSGKGRVARALQLRCDRLGLVGRADVVEFLPAAGPDDPEIPFPVEYKRGSSGKRQADQIQLCAQAMALEEMTGVRVPEGALFYHSSRRRVPVVFTDELRRETEERVARLREIFSDGIVPGATLAPRCRRCSLREACQPASEGSARASDYLRSIVLGEHSGRSE